MNKPATLLLLLLSISLASIAQEQGAEPERLNSDSAPFAYEAHADIPTPQSELAKMISLDYRRAPDEFTAQELFLKIKPVIENRIEEARKVSEWRFVIGDRLAEYDFERGGFPTKMNADTFLTYGNDYAAIFSNISEYSLVPVPLEKAKQFADSLRRDRTVSIGIEGNIEDAKEKTLNNSKRKTIIIKINRMTLKLADGRILGSFMPAAVKDAQ